MTNATTKKVENFNSEKTFRHTKQETCEVYLRQVKSGAYELMCLGINGEARPHMKFNLRFEHSRINNLLDKSLITDRHGKLYLGKLDDVLKLSVSGNGLNRTWDISGTKSDFWKYPTSMNILSGGGFSFPIKDMWNPAKPNELLR